MHIQSFIPARGEAASRGWKPGALRSAAILYGDRHVPSGALEQSPVPGVSSEPEIGSPCVIYIPPTSKRIPGGSLRGLRT